SGSRRRAGMWVARIAAAGGGDKRERRGGAAAGGAARCAGYSAGGGGVAGGVAPAGGGGGRGARGRPPGAARARGLRGGGRIPAGKFATKGKRSRVRDKDGSAIQVITGHKESGAVSAGFGGMIALVIDKGGTALKLRVQGLDLGRLSGSASVTIAVGLHSAT